MVGMQKQRVLLQFAETADLNDIFPAKARWRDACESTTGPAQSLARPTRDGIFDPPAINAARAGERDFKAGYMSNENIHEMRRGSAE